MKSSAPFYIFAIFTLVVGISPNLYSQNCNSVSYLMSIEPQGTRLLKSTYQPESGSVHLEHLSYLQDGGHLATMPGGDVIYTVKNSLLSRYQVSNDEEIALGNITTLDGGSISNMHQMSFSPDLTLFSSSSSSDEIYKVNYTTLKATNLGKIRTPVGSEREFIDISGGDMAFAHDGTMYITGGKDNNNSRYVFRVEEEPQGLVSFTVSGPFIRITGMAILDAGHGDILLSRHHQGFTLVNRETGEFTENLTAYIGDDFYQVQYGDMSSACVSFNPVSHYTMNIDVDPAKCPVIPDLLGDETSEYMLEYSGDYDAFAQQLSQLSNPILGVDDAILDLGLVHFSTQDGQIIGLEGENDSSNPLQYQRFLAKEDVALKIKMALRETEYQTSFGIYTYPKGSVIGEVLENSVGVTMMPLIDNNAVDGTEVEFSIPADNYFGFYIYADVAGEVFKFYTENRFNSDVDDVMGNDEQRPSGLTDHFVFFQTSNGLSFFAEDHVLSTANNMLGTQEYRGFVGDLFTCVDGRHISTTQIADTGVPSAAGEAGLESSGSLAHGYAVRDILGNRGYQISGSTSSKLVAGITGVSASTSPLASKWPFESLAHLKLSNNYRPSGGLSSLIPKSGPKNSIAHEATPFDIPLISNAIEAVGVEYRNGDGKTIGSIFATETVDKVYDHAKGVCDRASGARLYGLDLVPILTGSVFVAEIRNPQRDQRDSAMMFSVYVKGDTQQIDSRWIIDDYPRAENFDHIYNFQVWSSEFDVTQNLVARIMKNISQRGKTSFFDTDRKVTQVFFQSGELNGDVAEFVIENRLGRAVSVDIIGTNLRHDQNIGDGHQLNQHVELRPGRNYVKVTLGSSYFDGLFYIQAQSDYGRDAIYLSTGAYSFYAEKDTDAEFSSSDCPKFDDTIKGRHLPGCGEVNGNSSENISLFRSIKVRGIQNFDTLSFHSAHSNRVQLCLEAKGTSISEFPCLDIRLNPTLNSVSFKEILKDKPISYLNRVNGVSFRPILQQKPLKISLMSLHKKQTKFSLIHPVQSVTKVELKSKFSDSALKVWQYANGVFNEVTDEQPLKPDQGYYIESKDNIILMTQGEEGSIPSLRKGWNLVGFQRDHLSVAGVVDLYPDHNITAIWGYENGGYTVAIDNEASKVYPELKSLRSHRGYWIYSR